MIGLDLDADVIPTNQTEKAYSLTSSTWHKGVPLSKLQKWVRRWHEDGGDFDTINLEGHWWNTGTNGSYLTLTYSIQGSKSTQQATLVLSTINGKASVDSCRFTTLPP